jgi:hypothetical protein
MKKCSSDDGVNVHVLEEAFPLTFSPNFPKAFLRLSTKIQASDSPITLAKSFFANSLVDYKGLEFYHHH